MKIVCKLAGSRRDTDVEISTKLVNLPAILSWYNDPNFAISL